MGAHGGDGLEDGGRAAGAWGIDDYDVGTNAVSVKPGHDISGVADEEFGVFYMVVASVLLCVANGRRHDLDTDGTVRTLRQKQGDGAGAAVDVENRFPPGERGIGQRLLIEDFRLLGIHLKEGSRRNVEGQTPDSILDRRLSPEELRFPPENDVIMVRLNILLDADEIR